MEMRWRGIAALALALAAGCGGSRAVAPDAAPSPIEVVLSADAQLNQDDARQSLPTVVRIYQLKSARRIEKAGYEEMYRQPKDALGEDLVAADEVILTPGAVVRRTIDRDRGAKVLAAVAVVRVPLGMTWRVVADLPAPTEPARLAFDVVRYSIARK